MKNRDPIKILNKSHYDKIEEILSFDRNLSGHACILFGVTSDYRVKNEINRVLKDRMSPDHSFFILDISGYERENYQKILNEIIDKNSGKKSFFVIDGLDMLIKRDGGDGNKPDILVFLNYNREFFRDNQIHILFWIREESESLLFDESPDLWAFRNSVFHFDAAPPAILSYEEHLRRIGLPFSMSDDREEIEIKIKAKKNLLKKYERYAPEDRETIRNLLEDLAGLYLQISIYNEAKRMAERALKIEETPHSLNILAVIYFSIGDFENSMKYLKRALNLSQKQSSKFGEAVALMGMGFVCNEDKHGPDVAIDYFKRASKIFKEVDRRDMEAITIGCIGGIYLKKGDPDKALNLYEKALEINKEIGNRIGEADQMGNIGILYRDKGDFDIALDYHQKALEINKEIGDEKGEAYQLEKIGILYREKGDFDIALDYHQKALEINRETGNRDWEAHQLGNIGILYRKKGDFDIALDYHQKALEINKERGDRIGEAGQLGNIGILYREKGDFDIALDYHNKALEINKEIGRRLAEADQLNKIGDTYSKKGDVDKALDYHNKALEINKEIGSRLGEADQLNKIGEIYSNIGDVDKALDYYKSALEINMEIGSGSGESLSLLGIVSLYMKKGDIENALKYIEKLRDTYKRYNYPMKNELEEYYEQIKQEKDK
ncbi:MAG: tetratricopeptide repeat protein [Candidatus Eremiobacteraeota bacterium]|nr:tetratricopeptide repeat protein [Candidatus Eremiobacteraeota bacterium]